MMAKKPVLADMTKTALNATPKDELVDLAERNGVEIADDALKPDIVDALVDARPTTNADTPEAKPTVREKTVAAVKQFTKADAQADAAVKAEEARLSLAIRGY